MPNGTREWKSHMYYHVTARGNNRCNLFRSVSDFEYFYKLLKKAYERYSFELVAYCLMSNHYHLLIKSPITNISTVMNYINKRYADYYKKIHDHTGHVFDRRFFSSPVDGPVGLLNVSSYIHYNPVNARIVKVPQDYMQSSFSYFEGSKTILPEYLSTNAILSLFEGDRVEQYNKYVDWMMIFYYSRQYDWKELEFLKLEKEAKLDVETVSHVLEEAVTI